MELMRLSGAPARHGIFTLVRAALADTSRHPTLAGALPQALTRSKYRHIVVELLRALVEML